MQINSRLPISIGESSGSISSAPNRRHEIDTLDDSDLAPEFDFLALEEGKDDEDITLNTSFPEVDFAKKIDLQPFTLASNRQKKYYTLLKTAEDIKNPSHELTTLCEKAREEIERVEKLHRDGKKFENKGEAQIALEKYQQITTTVTDFPTIDSDIHRIKQTLALLADISPGKTLDFSEPQSSEKSAPPVKNGNGARRGKRAPRKHPTRAQQSSHQRHTIFFYPKIIKRAECPYSCSLV